MTRFLCLAMKMADEMPGSVVERVVESPVPV